MQPARPLASGRMPNAPAEPLVLNSSATLRRAGRVLLGWLSEEEGALALAGRQLNGAGSDALRAAARAARHSVELRPE